MQLKIGRLKGGLCVYWYENGKRVRYQLDARDRAAAEAEAIEVYRRVKYATRPRGQTIAEIWQAYKEDLGDRPTAKTMQYTGKAILPHFGHYRPEDVTKAMCVAYVDKRDAKQGTVWTELGHLQSALNFAAKTRMIDRAPKVWRPQKPDSDIRILNRGEARKLIDAAMTPHIRLAIILLLGTAGRVGAILDLTWDRVDFERGTINLRIQDSKTRKGRAIVPMNNSTRAALSVAHEAALSDYVVEYAADRVGSIRTGFYNAVERAGLKDVTIHSLRHTAAVTMLAAGVPIEKVAQVLGHSNVSVTYRVYGRYMPEHMQDAVDVLDFATIRKGA